MPDTPSTSQRIRTLPRPNCIVCDSSGREVYTGLSDFSYAAPGVWTFRKCTNSTCGLLWLDPVPAPEDIGLAYQGYYTHHQPEPGPSLLRDVSWAVWNSYLGRRFGYERGTGPKWRRAFAPLALLHPGGRDELDAAAMHLPAPCCPAKLLEVGCGSGVALARMQKFGWQVEGVEVDPAAVDAARARGVSVRLGTLEAQGFPDNEFDAIHSAHVLEHLHDPVGLLKECRRILKPGGTLVLLTPNAEGLAHNTFKEAWLGLDPPRHLAIFTLGSLKLATEQSGLQIIKLDSTVRIAWVVGALSHSIRRTGRGEMRELGSPAALMKGFAYQFKERRVRRHDVSAGGELRLTATK